MLRFGGSTQHSFLPRKRVLCTLAFAGLSLPPVISTLYPARALAAQTSTAASTPTSLPEGTLFRPEQIAALLPATVYFQGRTASLQLRNAAGLQFKGKSIFWTSLVDTSGYASDVQEKYEFYLVTEGPLRIGATVLQPGAYGGGFPGGHFVIMDLGGHTLAQGPLQGAPTTVRPRPLQLIQTSPDAVNLCLRRQCIAVHALPYSQPQ